MFGPGLALLLALGVRQRLILLGATAAVSVGVAVLVASGCALIGQPFGPTSLLVGSLLLAALGFGVSQLLHRRLGSPAVRPLPAAVLPLPLLPRLSGTLSLLAQLAGVVFLLIGMGLVLKFWLAGLGSLSTYNQDHDPILHMVLTAYIQRTGRGAPWQIMPADVVIGTPTVYYPGGFHLIAASIGGVFGDPVLGVNAAVVMIIGVAWIASAGALGAVAVRWLSNDAGWTLLAGGIAALVAAGLYRPGVQLARDNGVLPNAAALVLVPGLVAAILIIRPKAWATAVGLGVACAGIVAVHPSSGLSVGLTLLLFWVALLFVRDGRAMLRSQWSVLLLMGLTAAIVAAPVLRGALAVSGRISAFPTDVAPIPITGALGAVVPLIYGGFFDDSSSVQVWPTVLLIIGFITALVMRRAVPLVVAWGGWVIIVLLAYRNPSGVTAPILAFFYNSVGRVQSHIPLFAPALAALGAFGLLRVLLAGVSSMRLPSGLGALGSGVAGSRRPMGPGSVAAPTRVGLVGWSRRSIERVSLDTLRPRVVGAIGVVVMTAFGFGYAVGPNGNYLNTNALALSDRWANPELYRVDAADVAAAEWLKARIKPGQRIMNSPNDGSTYLYVAHGLPIVEISTLGVPNFPYTYKLMKDFRYLAIDPEVRRLILDLNIAWVYVDWRAPIIGASGAPGDWAGGGLMTTVPGLEQLDRTPGLILAHVSGDVHIYKVDLDAIRQLDEDV